MQSSLASIFDVMTSNYLSFAIVFVAGALFGFGVRSRIMKKTKRERNNPTMEVTNFMKPDSDFHNGIHQQKVRIKKAKLDFISPIKMDYEEIIPEEKSEPIELEPGINISQTAISDDSVAIKYFPNPNQDGNFRNADGRNNFIEGASIYKFSMISGDEALFEYCEESSAIGIALNNRNELILSVADETNSYNPGASKISLMDNEKGRAILEGSIWRVTQKAKIKYI